MGLFHSIISIIIMSLCESTVILIFPHQYSYSFQSWEDFSIWIIPTALSKFFYFLAMLILQTIFSRQYQFILYSYIYALAEKHNYHLSSVKC